MALSKILIVTSITLGPVVLVMLALSLSTNFWITYTVDRSKLTDAERLRSRNNRSLSFYHSRSRGLFRECFSSDDINFLDKNRQSDCVNIEYEPPKYLLTTASQEYWTRIHLMRCHFAFLILGLASFLLSYMLAVALCCQKRPVWAKSAGVFAYLSAFASAGSVAFFHGVEYMERSVINTFQDGFTFYANWPKGLQDATVRQYDWSYILCWVGSVLAAICGTLFVISAWLIQNERKKTGSRKVLPKRFIAEPNLGPVMMPPEQLSYHYDDPRFNTKYLYPGAYVGPYMYDMSDRGYPGYGEQPLWHWQ